MTIISTRYLEPVLAFTPAQGAVAAKAPRQIWHATDPPFKGYQPPPSDAFEQTSHETAIVIDNGKREDSSEPAEICTAHCSTGASLLRAGWSFDTEPRISFPANVARYRDRKLNRTCSYVGYDAYADATTRGQIRNAFEPGSSIVSNWDVMEGVLDSTFVGLGIDGAGGGIDRPVLMTEPLANLGYSRKSCVSIYSCPKHF